MWKRISANLKTIVPEAEFEPHVMWRSIGVLAWVSFLFAGLASMLFFASFEPTDLASLATYSVNWSAQAIYTLGFILFWLFGFMTSLVSIMLLALPWAKRARHLPD